MAQLSRSPQTLSQQFREVHVFALLGAIRIAMLWFSGALEAIDQGIPLARQIAASGLLLRAPLIIIYLLVLLPLYGRLLQGKLVAAWILDLLGVWTVLSLFGHFIKINILMLTNTVEPKLLLGQVLTYLLFFVIAWGWLFWRLDRLAGPRDQVLVSLSGASGVGDSFDYFYASLMSLLEAKISVFRGVNRFGKTLVAIHSFMVLDLAAIALARFYQLVQKSI